MNQISRESKFTSSQIFVDFWAPRLTLLVADNAIIICNYWWAGPSFPSESVQILFFNDAMQGVHESLVWDEIIKGAAHFFGEDTKYGQIKTVINIYQSFFLAPSSKLYAKAVASSQSFWRQNLIPKIRNFVTSIYHYMLYASTITIVATRW